MKDSHYEFLQSLASAHRKTLIGVLLVTGLIITALSGALLYTTLYRTRTVLMPPMLTKPVTIGRDYLDDNYLTQLAQYLVWLRFNVSPETVNTQNAQFLAYALPDKQRLLAHQLGLESRVIIDDRITGSFFIDGVSVDTQHGLVRITGTQHKYVKMRALPAKHKTVLLQFAAPEGVLMLSAMTTTADPS